MRCGGIFSDNIITNFFRDSDSEKMFEHLSIFDEVIRRAKKLCQFFGATLYI